MMNILNWIKDNWESLAVIFSGLVAVATAITRLTPTEKDDVILNKIVAFFNHFSILNTKEDQKIIDDAKGE